MKREEMAPLVGMHFFLLMGKSSEEIFCFSTK